MVLEKEEEKEVEKEEEEDDEEKEAEEEDEEEDEEEEEMASPKRSLVFWVTSSSFTLTTEPLAVRSLSYILGTPCCV